MPYFDEILNILRYRKLEIRQIPKFTVWTPFQPQFGGILCFYTMNFSKIPAICSSTVQKESIISTISNLFFHSSKGVNYLNNQQSVLPQFKRSQLSKQPATCSSTVQKESVISAISNLFFHSSKGVNYLSNQQSVLPQFKRSQLSQQSAICSSTVQKESVLSTISNLLSEFSKRTRLQHLRV